MKPTQMSKSAQNKQTKRNKEQPLIPGDTVNKYLLSKFPFTV